MTMTKREIINHLRAAKEYEDEVGGDYDALYDAVRLVLRRG